MEALTTAFSIRHVDEVLIATWRGFCSRLRSTK